MTTDEVRDKYLKFFEARGHKIIPPASLILENDPTTLFTSSGMQPLVPYLMGEPHPEGKRVVDSQPAIRLQDIEEVGDDRHTTYFEMLGNWGFGDYFKKEQLPWIWDFLTNELGLPGEKLYVSIFEGNKDVPRDEESYEIWKSLGLQDDHIFKYDVKKNWWSRSGAPNEMPVGEIGGPTSEIFFEFTQVEHDKRFGDRCHPNCDCGRFFEIGNSVFLVYKKTKGGLEELPHKNVDFGGGLERLVAAANDIPDMFEIDVFAPLIKQVEKLSGKKYKDSKKAMQIIADHIRAADALAQNNVIPANKLQGYVMRRLIRRAVIKMKSLRSEVSGEDFAKLTDKKEIIEEVDKFQKTLDKGLREFEKLDNIDGKIAFDLYQTYGFPFELTLELAQEKGLEVDVNEFRKAFGKHQEKSRTASAGVFKGGLADHSIEVTRLHTAHHLVLAALQKVVDKNISQKGSNITAERMRMDFNLERKLTSEEVKKVEDLVNEKIDEDLPVTKKIMPREEAEKMGAQMEFGKKYPDNVSVYFIGPTSPAAFSLEFCGGPHVANTIEIKGHVRIMKEESVAAGVRRIYASIG
jgi:alanyl-tRNA synthetase